MTVFLYKILNHFPISNDFNTKQTVQEAFDRLRKSHAWPSRRAQNRVDTRVRRSFLLFTYLFSGKSRVGGKHWTIVTACVGHIQLLLLHLPATLAMTRLLSDMSSQCCLIVATLLCFFSTSATAHLIKPYSYDLTFKLPLADQATFSGSLVLHFQLQQDTDTLVLNSHGLSSFRNISLISNQQNPLDFTIKSVKILSNTLEISYQEVLTAGEYLLTIEEYEGKIYNSTYGLFRRDKMFTTHLQPHGASRLFPCVDDISIKAPFRVSVIHSTDTVAQANTIATDVQVGQDEIYNILMLLFIR